MTEPTGDVTALLQGISAGNRNAWNALLSLVYRELHKLAHESLRRLRPGQTLQTTALIHEAYMRLVKNEDARWTNRDHFFKVAARAMRQILVDEYRRRKAAKRGLGMKPLPLEEMDEPAVEFDGQEHPLYDLEALDGALKKLEAYPEHNRKCTLVELRFFVGLTHKETAEVLGVSAATVARDWEFTRAWLYQELSGAGDDVHGSRP